MSHTERSIDLWRREANGDWSRTTAGPGQTLTLVTASATPAVDDVYQAAGV